MIEVIAEIGVNHNGSVDIACKLIDAAKDAGCDAAKFQLFDTERVYPRERWDEMKRLELSRADMLSLKGHSDNVGIEFLCTPDEIEDAQFLKSIGVRRIKTSSQDITNVPFFLQFADLGLPMIVSTGACSEIEMGYALGSIIGHQRKSANASPSLTILHCVSAYPAPLEEMNLSVIAYLRRTYGPNVGLSDHTIGKAAALIALGLGARIFEKHLRLIAASRGRITIRFSCQSRCAIM